MNTVVVANHLSPIRAGLAAISAIQASDHRQLMVGGKAIV